MKTKTELLAMVDRVTAERDAALADVDRLNNALNVTDVAATKWLSDLTKARELFELFLDDPRLVVAMSSDILVPIKSLLSSSPEPFESKVDALQQRLTAADERADVLEGLLGRASDVLEACGQGLRIRRMIDAALKPAEPMCPKCNDTGETDSGGVQPWGEGINIPCDCKP